MDIKRYEKINFLYDDCSSITQSLCHLTFNINFLFIYRKMDCAWKGSLHREMTLRKLYDMKSIKIAQCLRFYTLQMLSCFRCGCHSSEEFHVKILIKNLERHIFKHSTLLKLNPCP